MALQAKVRRLQYGVDRIEDGGWVVLGRDTWGVVWLRTWQPFGIRQNCLLLVRCGF